jgi:hypothetical protein
VDDVIGSSLLVLRFVSAVVAILMQRDQLTLLSLWCSTWYLVASFA